MDARGRVRTDIGPVGALLSDRDKVHRILLNLVDNARKYAPTGPSTSRWHRADGTVRFTVDDRGPGVRPEDRERIFERFVQLDGSSTRRQGGTGLGLHLCRELAQMLAGTLTVGGFTDRRCPLHARRCRNVADATSSRPSPHPSSAGAEVQLPVSSAPKIRSSPAPTPHRRRRRDRHRSVTMGVQRVLVVDDEPTIRQLLEINLLAEGIHVAAVADGFSARRAALSDPPDLIILDVMMPGLDGLELLRELRADPRTADDPGRPADRARTSDAEVWAGWAAGADYYLTKPFDVDELLDFLETFGARARSPRSRRPSRQPRPSSAPEAERGRGTPVAPWLAVASAVPTRGARRGDPHPAAARAEPVPARQPRPGGLRHRDPRRRRRGGPGRGRSCRRRTGRRAARGRGRPRRAGARRAHRRDRCGRDQRRAR